MGTNRADFRNYLTSTVGIAEYMLGRNDFVLGSQFSDFFSGDRGDDTLIGYDGDDTLRGGFGNDQLIGGNGNDIITGGRGHDTLFGDDGQDRIQGGRGNDEIHGGRGYDRLFGDGGNDTIIGGESRDDIDGGPGFDISVYSGPIQEYQAYDLVAAPSGGQATVRILDLDQTNGNDGIEDLVRIEALDFSNFTLLINGANSLPVGVSDTIALDEDSGTTIIGGAGDEANNILADDYDFGYDGTAIIDLSGDLTVTEIDVFGGPILLPGETANLAEGDLSIAADGVVTFTTAQDATGTISAMYTLTDAGGDSTSAILDIEIANLPDDPVFTDTDVGAFSEDFAAVAMFDLSSLISDPDPGDTASITSVVSSGDALVYSRVGTRIEIDFAQFQPLAPGDQLDFEFTVNIEDTTGRTGSGVMTGSITGENDKPVADNATAAATEDDGIVSIDLALLISDIDNGDSASVNFANSSAVISRVGDVVSFDAHQFNSLMAGATTDFDIDYAAADTFGASDTGTVTVTVTGVNDAIDAADATLDVNENDGPFVIDLSTYVTDPDIGDTMTFSEIAVTRDSDLVPLTDLGGGMISVDPAGLGLNAGDSTSTDIIFAVTDGSGSIDRATLTLNIAGEGDPPPPPANVLPTAGPLTLSLNEADGPASILLSDFISDPDGGDYGEIISLRVASYPQFPVERAVDYTASLFGEAGATLNFSTEQFLLGNGDLEALTLTYTVRYNDTPATDETGTITLNLTGYEPAPPADLAPTYSDPLSAPIEVDDVATEYVFDLDNFINDPDGDNALLTVTPGNLVIGTDEATGTPITVAYAYDALSREVTVDFADLALADGEDLTAVLHYTVADATTTIDAMRTLPFTNPAEPVAPVQTTFDFEGYANPDGASIELASGFGGLLTTGSLTVVETDELLASGRGNPDIALGQTTSGGDNVLAGRHTTLFTQDTDPITGDPIFDPVTRLPVGTTSVDEVFSIADDGFRGKDAPGIYAGFGDPATQFPDPADFEEFIGSPFDLDGLSLHVDSDGPVTITIATWEAYVETINIHSPTLHQWEIRYREADTFEFTVDGSNAAQVLDFDNALLNDDNGPIDPAAFDDIFYFELVADGGVDAPTIIVDDLLITA